MRERWHITLRGILPKGRSKVKRVAMVYKPCVYSAGNTGTCHRLLPIHHTLNADPKAKCYKSNNGNFHSC